MTKSHRPSVVSHHYPTPRQYVRPDSGLRDVVIWFVLMFFVGIPLGVLLMGGSVAIVRNLDRQEASK